MKARTHDILIVGELNVDLILSGDVTPEFGQVEKIVDDFSMCAGSSTGIFAASAAKMGLKVLVASKVGDDPFGHFMIDALEAAGVDTSLVEVDPAIKTGVTVILSRAYDRAIITYLGSIAEVSGDDVQDAWYGLARHLHVASPFLLDALRPAIPSMMRSAKEAGMTVSLDTNWDPTEKWALDGFFDHLDVFFPNENELLAITQESDLEQAINQMAARMPVLVVKRGDKGAIAVRGTERVEVPAMPIVVVDTTGAGDTFDGGFLAGWLRGESLQRCAQLGAACGSSTATQVGGFNGQPTWSEALALLK